MLKAKTCSLPAGLKADSTFDIFRRLPDGNFACVAVVQSLRETKKRINRLAKQNAGNYLIHSQGVVF
jgi:hypothetical protein